MRTPSVHFVNCFYLCFRSFSPFHRKTLCFPPIVGLCRFYVTLLTLLTPNSWAEGSEGSLLFWLSHYIRARVYSSLTLFLPNTSNTYDTHDPVSNQAFRCCKCRKCGFFFGYLTILYARETALEIKMYQCNQ